MTSLRDMATPGKGGVAQTQPGESVYDAARRHWDATVYVDTSNLGYITQVMADEAARRNTPLLGYVRIRRGIRYPVYARPCRSRDLVLAAKKI